MAGFNPSDSAVRSAKGVAPYRPMPSRAMSPCEPGWAKIPAVLARLFGSAMLFVAASKRRIASSIPGGPSAVAKCVMSVMDFAAPDPCSRSSMARATGTANPRRFMPVLILKKTSSGFGGLAVSSMRSCSSECTTVARSFAAMMGSSDGSKKPSSSRIGCEKPRSRVATAPSSSTVPSPSARTRAFVTRSMPCPYAFAFTIA